MKKNIENHITATGQCSLNIEDFKNISDLIEGCGSAVVTFGVTDEGKLVKLVTFHPVNVMCFDEIVRSQGELVNRLNPFPIYRQAVYHVEPDKKLDLFCKYFTTIVRRFKDKAYGKRS